MKFIYCADKDVIREMENKGLNQVREKTIGGKNYVIFENNPSVKFSTYAKYRIHLSNSLDF